MYIIPIKIGGVGSVDFALVGEAADVGVGVGVVDDEVESDFVGLGEGDLVQVGGEDSVGEDGAGGAEAEAEDPDAESRRGGTERGGGGGGGGDFAIYFGVASRGIIPDFVLRRAIFFRRKWVGGGRFWVRRRGRFGAESARR